MPFLSVRGERTKPCFENVFLIITFFLYFCSFTRNQTDSGDRLSLELTPADQGGRLKVSLAVGSDTGYTSEAGFDLNDNRWHNIDLRFSPDGFLQLQLDAEVISIVNASEVSSSALFRQSSPTASVVIGQGYTGCLLEGPAIRFLLSNDEDDQSSGSENLLMGQCPIPLSGNCSKLFFFLRIIQLTFSLAFSLLVSHDGRKSH